ncbi:MAG: hypothetical protein ABJF50_22955 [Paracoccaceae bacterium]|uniref:hypothetical protein n=1 Tax=Yoonia sp. TaxID=2212373 RepID=UPI00327192AF
MSEASIVFRTKDMFSTEKIYIDNMEKAAMWASIYRNASYFVDVINRHDEVAYRWENGAPDWKLGEVIPAALHVESYRFERHDDLSWEPQNRLWALIEAVTFAFDTAVGRATEYDFEGMFLRTEQPGNDDVWDLIVEANQVAREAAKLQSAVSWADLIDNWMNDSTRLFNAYALEQTALDMYTYEQEPFAFPNDIHDNIPKLMIEITELKSQRKNLP